MDGGSFGFGQQFHCSGRSLFFPSILFGRVIGVLYAYMSEIATASRKYDGIHRRELPVIHYHKVILIYPYPFSGGTMIGRDRKSVLSLFKPEQ